MQVASSDTQSNVGNSKMAATQASSVPPNLYFDEMVTNIDCHPSRNLVAACFIDGRIIISSFEVSSNEQLLNLSHHKKSCRTVNYSCDGNLLFTGSKDKSLLVIDSETGAITHNFKQAHDSPIYTVLPIDQYLVASGDDDGFVKLWDFRREVAVMEIHSCEEYISDMVIDNAKRVLLATSGEGTLTAFNVRKKKMELQSELFDSELLSLAIIKDGNKVVCGSGDGTLYFFNWGEYGNMSDRFPGHPETIETIIPIAEDIICTGSSDGIIRAVNLLPNRFLGIVGEHDSFSVDKLCTSSDGELLVSSGQDQLVKFWNISNLEEEEVNVRQKANKTDKNKSLNPQNNNFFSDLMT